MEDIDFEDDDEDRPLSPAEELIRQASEEAYSAERALEEAENMAWLVQKIKGRGKPYGVDVHENDGLYVLMMPTGATPRAITILGSPAASSLLEIGFEKYMFIGQYNAIWSKENGTIEAGILGVGCSTGAALKRLNDSMGSAGWTAGHKYIEVKAPSDEDGIGIRIGFRSQAMVWFDGQDGPEGKGLFSLLISGIGAVGYERDTEILILTAISLFLQLHIQVGVGLQLDSMGKRSVTAPQDQSKPQEFQFMQATYDVQPTALYWSAVQMADRPFRFLRFYQCVEFYFPEPGPDEVKRAVGDIVRDKNFDPASLEHIEKIIAVAGKKVHTEEEQLEALLHKCLTADDVRSFLKAHPERRNAYSPKAGTCPYPKLNLYEQTADLLKSLAERLYKIRCSIVHSKRNAKSKTLMPDSDAAAQLGPDIELMEYVAQRVLTHHGDLMAGLRPLAIPSENGV